MAASEMPVKCQCQCNSSAMPSVLRRRIVVVVVVVVVVLLILPLLLVPARAGSYQHFHIVMLYTSMYQRDSRLHPLPHNSLFVVAGGPLRLQRLQIPQTSLSRCAAGGWL